ncbi:hypothetical protein ACIPFI_27875, partial [Pseudomonas sp. NPDC087039]
QKSDVPEYTTGFAASIFGVIGATGATLVSVRATQKALMLRLGYTGLGMAFGNGLLKLLGSKLFARGSGYPAIFLGLLSDGSKAFNQKEQGDLIAGTYTFAGGASIAIGSAVALEGGLAIVGAASFISFAALAATGIVLLGAAVIVGGLYLHSKASERIHTPLELWAARSIFGTRLNDGEHRKNITLDSEKRLPPFAHINEEIQTWHIKYFSPVMITAKKAQKNFSLELEEHSKDNHFRPQPDLSCSIHKKTSEPFNTAQFIILLREFTVGLSEWTGNLSKTSARGETTTIANSPQCYLTGPGLIIQVKFDARYANDAIFQISYRPNNGLNTSTETSARFNLED